MNARAIATLLAAAACAVASSPAEAARAAALDLTRKVPAPSRPHARYLSLYATPQRERPALVRAVDFWLNSLSRESELAPAVRVSGDLLRIDLRDYAVDAKVWDKLQDPYFTAPLKGKVAIAPWLDPTLAGVLVTLTQSAAPIVRADWWLVQTAQQADRKGTGYYDFLAVKDRKAFQALVGLDQKLAEKLQKEVRAIVSRSTVALNNRQIVRLQTLTGGYWATLDSLKNDKKNNAVRNLDADYRHDAEEVYGVLPNGLFAFFLGDAQGVRQDSAPDAIASDGRAPGTDRRVHVGVSCVRCHVEGIRPIDDWARKVYRGPVSLNAPDYDQLKRLRRLYLSDLERWVRRDQQDYAEVLLKLTGLKPAEMARAFARVHEAYEQADLLPADVAREAGVAEAALLAALKKYPPPLDPVLAGLLAAPPEPIRREHFEEVFPVLQNVLRGVVPLEVKK